MNRTAPASPTSLPGSGPDRVDARNPSAPDDVGPSMPTPPISEHTAGVAVEPEGPTDGPPVPPRDPEGPTGGDGGGPTAGDRGPDEPGVDDLPPTDEDDRSPRWSRLQWISIGLALAFLVGAAGYFIGVRSAEPPTSAVDEGFLQDMTDHHDQAVEMALLGTSRATDPVVREYAKEVLLFQRRELGMMQAYFDERGIVPAEYDPNRTTMAWMDMPVPLTEMTGMASEDQMEQLANATGTEFDQLWLELMIAHHNGGVHMAQDAAEHAADPKIRLLADRMARNQSAEIPEYQGTLDRLRGRS